MSIDCLYNAKLRRNRRQKDLMRESSMNRKPKTVSLGLEQNLRLAKRDVFGASSSDRLDQYLNTEPSIYFRYASTYDLTNRREEKSVLKSFEHFIQGHRIVMNWHRLYKVEVKQF